MDMNHITDELKIASRDMKAGVMARYQVFSPQGYYISVNWKLDVGGTLSKSELIRELDIIGGKAINAVNGISKNLKSKMDHFKTGDGESPEFEFKASKASEYDVLLGRGIGVVAGVHIETDWVPSSEWSELAGDFWGGDPYATDAEGDKAFQAFMEDLFKQMHVKGA